MSRIELVAPCHFGLEAVLKKEIVDLGYEIVQVEDGKVIFAGDEAAVCRANIFLRTAERVLLKVGKFRAVTFDELFEKIKALPWENYIPSDGKFWVAKASSVKSKLFSPSDIQSIVKKAMVDTIHLLSRNGAIVEFFQLGMVDYVISNDTSVSRQHAVIQRKNGQFFVTDLGSTNGTFVNEKRISGTVQLQDGDNIRYADVISVFNIVR